MALLYTHDAPDHARYLTSGNWYKLIKCQQDGKSTIKTNKLFKPVRSMVKDEIEDIADQVENLERSIGNAASAKTYKDFETL